VSIPICFTPGTVSGWLAFPGSKKNADPAIHRLSFGVLGVSGRIVAPRT